MGGNRLLLLDATTATEKSSRTKALARQAKLIAQNTPTPSARDGARRIAA